MMLNGTGGAKGDTMSAQIAIVHIGISQYFAVMI
jgi:hypothetical protein